MTTKTLDCAECGASVAYGRLSCPDCGALLASVAGSVAPRARSSDDTPSPLPDIDAGAANAPDPSTISPDAPPAVVVAKSAATRATPRPSKVVSRGPALAAATTLSGVPYWPADAVAVADERHPAQDPVVTDAQMHVSSSIDTERLSEIAGWFVIVGAGLSILGFLLPWSRVVIGAGSYSGYLSSWGLASPSHLLLFLAIVTLLAIAVVPSPRIPTWLAFGVVGLGLGALLIGLAWPYVVGPLGAQIGVLIVMIGGATLVAGGALTTWASRHLEAGSTV
jgi:hypothetical protein